MIMAKTCRSTLQVYTILISIKTIYSNVSQAISRLLRESKMPKNFSLVLISSSGVILNFSNANLLLKILHFWEPSSSDGDHIPVFHGFITKFVIANFGCYNPLAQNEGTYQLEKVSGIFAKLLTRNVMTK